MIKYGGRDGSLDGGVVCAFSPSGGVARECFTIICYPDERREEGSR